MTTSIKTLFAAAFVLAGAVPAVAAFDADPRGSVTEGKLADLVVVHRNLLKIDPKDILGMNVDLPMVGGRIVYERKLR